MDPCRPNSSLAGSANLVFSREKLISCSTLMDLQMKTQKDAMRIKKADNRGKVAKSIYQKEK